MDQVAEIKGKVDIVELVGEHVLLKRAGRNYKGNCPFHGEKTPSFMVNPELQIFKCFGCGESGDVFSFLQKMEGMDFGEALQNLAKRTGITLTSYKPNPGEEAKDRLIKINVLTAEAYHYLLTEHKSGKKALGYIKERGLGDEVIKKFRIGYAPDEWQFLTNFLVHKKKYNSEDLKKCGLIVEGRGYDRFRNRIMFPLNNQRGQTVGFAGRILSGENQAKYVNTSETEIYHKSELLYGLDITRSDIKQADLAIVVEGEIDMIASWQAGVRNVVAIKGSALTEKQVELLRRLCGTIILALDADFAGDAAARRGIEIADKKGMMVKMVKLVGAKDPGDYAISDPEGWKKIVEEAIPVYDFYIESAVARFGLDVEGKKKIGQELLPILMNISDEIVKAHYIHKLAEVLGVREEDVRNQLVKTPNFAKATSGKQNPMTKVQKSRREVMAEYLVGLAVNGHRWDKLSEIVELLGDGFWRKVVQALIVEKDVNKLPPELKVRVEGLVFFGDEWSDIEWEKARAELEEVGVRESLQAGGDNTVGLSRRLGELTRGK